MAKNIQITSKLGLQDVERILQSSSEGGEEVRLWLPSEVGPQFFKYSRLCYLIASLSRQCQLQVVDWGQSTERTQLQRRYGTTIEGLASVVYANQISDVRAATLDLDPQATKWKIEEREGRVETEGLGAALSYCCFDEERSVSLPIALSRVNASRDGFVNDFRRVRAQYFERGVAEGYSERIQPSLFDVTVGNEGDVSLDPDEAVASFVYELFQNGFRHGCRNKDGTPIPGLRYLALRKHVGHDKASFVERAKSFEELEHYLSLQTPKSGTFSFLEISVSDHGLGIIDRFLATRPDYRLATESIDERLALLNRIIRESLTSNTMQSGAGRGLERALTAVQKLRGFVSLRTDRLWMFWAAGSDETAVSLTPVAVSDPLGHVAGTHFNLLFPLVS